jgi:hypothetical protein
VIPGNNTITAGAWTPRRRGADLYAWLRADLGVTLASGAVAAWADQSGNGRNFAQGTPSLRLGHSASDAAFNNLPVVIGSTTGELPAVGAWTRAQPLTLYAVTTSGNSGDWKTVVDATAGDRAVLRADPTEQGSIFAGSANVTGTTLLNSPSIVCAVFNGASSALYIRSTTAAATGNPGTQGIGTPIIGRAAPGPAYYLPTDGKIAELVWIAGADSAAQRAQMFRYFSRRYALAVTGL